MNSASTSRKWEQFVAYLRELAHGNLGVSYDNDRPVAGNLATALGNTVPMVGLATITAIALGMLTGVVSAWRRGTGLDHVNVNVAIAFFAFPVQWFGLMLLTRFAGVLPTGLGLYGGSTLVVRSSMLDTLGEDYILTARAKGLSPWQVVRRHALPNAMPTATLIALSLGQIVAGAILSSIRATGWESSGSPGAGRPPPCSPSSGSCPRAPRWPDAWRSRARSCSSPATRLRGATAGGTSPPCFRGR